MDMLRRSSRCSEGDRAGTSVRPVRQDAHGGTTLGTNRYTIARVLTSSTASTAVSAVLGFVVLPQVLHHIRIQRYGEWATLAALLAIGQLAEAGVGTEVARRVATAFGLKDAQGLHQAVREGTTVLLLLAAALAAFGLGVSRPVVDLVFATVSAGDRGQLVVLLRGVVGLLAVGLVSSGYFGALKGLQRGDYANWSGIAALVVSAVVTVTGVALGFGLWALFLADAMGLLVTWGGQLIGTRHALPDLGFRLVRISPAVLLGFVAMPAMLMVASASDLFDSQVDKLVLTHVAGPSAAGTFQIATTVVLGAKGLALIPLGVLLAGTAELYLTDPGRLRRLEALASSGAQAIGAVAAGGFLIFTRVFIGIWLGAGYPGVTLSMQFLAGAVLFNVWTAPWTYYAIGRGRYYYVVIAAGVTAAVNALATLLLTAKIGLLGALIGSLAGSVAGGLAGWLVLRTWERRRWLRPALRASGAVAVVVAPFLIARGRIPASLGGLAFWGALYVAACGLVLAITGALPVTVVLRPGARPRLVWREGSMMGCPADEWSEA
jgi:O-antigen/teichoic acid export membrane protein